MIAVLLRRHVWHQRWLLLSLLLGLIAFPVLLISIGAAVDRGPGVLEILEKMPKWVQKMIEQHVGDVSFRAFPAFGFEHPVVLITGLAFVVFAGTLPAGERDSGLLDLVLARPLSRRQYLIAVLLQIVGAAVVFPACLMLGVILGLAVNETPVTVHWSLYAPAAVGLAALYLAWGGVAILFGTGRRRRGRIVAQLIALMLVLFLIHVLSTFSSRLWMVEWVSPFHYFHPLQVVLRGEPMSMDTFVLLGLFVVCTGAAFLRFERRDL